MKFSFGIKHGNFENEKQLKNTTLILYIKKGLLLFIDDFN